MFHWINIKSFRLRTIVAIAALIFLLSIVFRTSSFLFQNAYIESQLDEYLLGRLNFYLSRHYAGALQDALPSVDTELCGDVVVSKFDRDGRKIDSMTFVSNDQAGEPPIFDYLENGKIRTISYLTPDGNTIMLEASMDGYYSNRYVSLMIHVSVFVFLVIISIPANWFLLTRAMSGLDDITKTARLVQTNNLSARIDVAVMDSELQPMAINLNAMLDHVNVLHKVQSRFVADASHELRTPLAGIISNSELREGRTVEELRRSLRYCHESALRLNRLVNGLLELTREETSREKPHHRVLVETLLNEAVEQVQSIANAAGVELRIDLSDNSLIVLGDSDELFQVLVNLLSNAIYHSPQGGIVCLQACRIGSSVLFPSLALRVTDEGPGIDKALGTRVFDRFYRGASEYEGSGLGLAICKAIIDAHGGTISYRPNAPRGTVFEVTLLCPTDHGKQSKV
jgi:signal transduction histidine kinase